MKVGGAIVPTCVNLRRARFQVLLTEAITEKATPQFSWYPICSVNTQNPFIILLNVNIILFVCCGTLKDKQYLFWGNSWPRFVILCDYEWSSKSRFFFFFLPSQGATFAPLCVNSIWHHSCSRIRSRPTTAHLFAEVEPWLVVTWALSIWHPVIAMKSYIKVICGLFLWDLFQKAKKKIFHQPPMICKKN